MFFAAKKIDSRQRHQKSLPTVFGAVCSSISVYPLVDEADKQRHAGSALPAHSAGPGLRHAVTRITAGTFCRDGDAVITWSYYLSIYLSQEAPSPARRRCWTSSSSWVSWSCPGECNVVYCTVLYCTVLYLVSVEDGHREERVQLTTQDRLKH